MLFSKSLLAGYCKSLSELSTADQREAKWERVKYLDWVALHAGENLGEVAHDRITNDHAKLAIGSKVRLAGAASYTKDTPCQFIRWYLLSAHRR